MKKSLFIAVFCVLSVVACGKKNSSESASAGSASAGAVSSEEKVLNFYNWADYIPKDMIANFEKETGIKVNYQTFENNETLHAKLVAGNSGYDIVVPGSVFVKPQIDGGLLKKLNKTQIPNYANLDMDLMKNLNGVDPGNQYVLPWAWGFTTVGINSGKVKKALGALPMPANAWDLVFNPKYASKLASCGVAYLDSPTEIIPPAMHYLGKNAYSNDPADHKAAGAMLAKVRSSVKIFTSTLIDDLASGKVCAVVGWSGDINIARGRAIENKNGQDIQALLPETGALPFFDTLAIPADAKHPNNAHLFLNYFLRPEVSASLTNELNYPVANKAAMSKINPEVAQNKTIFPDATYMSTKFVPPSSFTNEARESMGAVYTQLKKGK